MTTANISPPLPTLTLSSLCPRCGAAFRCGRVAGDAECWCVKLPNVMPLPSAPSPAAEDAGQALCLCPVCLQQQLDTDAKPRLPAED